MNFFKKLFGIKSVKESDELLTPAEYKRLEEYAKQLVEAELKKDEPIPDKKSWVRIRDKKNVFKQKPKSKTTEIKIEDALYTIEEFHRYIECNAKSILSLLSQDEVDIMYKDWFKDTRRSFNDFIWSLFNRAKLANRINDIDYNKYGTIQNSEEAFYLRERDIYRDMARFRFKESENVKACNQWTRLSIEAEINSYIWWLL